jgi:hypothetical protein
LRSAERRVSGSPATGGDFCGAWATRTSARRWTPTAIRSTASGYAEKTLKGWGTRPSDWQIGATLQQEILPRVSVEVGYTRRWLKNFTVRDNLSVSAADFDQFSIVAPSDPVSRVVAATRWPVLYNVKPTSSRWRRTSLSTYAPDYGRSRRSTTAST